MKKILSIAISLSLAMVVTAQVLAMGMSESTSDEVTVYSHRHYESDQKLFDQFYQKTGIKVKVLKGDADQLIERIKTEGSSSPADLLITADVGRLYRAKTLGLLQSGSNAVLEAAIPAHLRDPQGFWFGLTKRARVIVYDKSSNAQAPVANYEDLALPAQKGKVVVRSSGNVYNISMLASLLGRWGEAATLEWAKGLANNLAQPPQGGDRDQMKALVAGAASLAITNTYYIGQLINSKDPVEQDVGKRMGVIFPNQNRGGTHINVSGAGIVKTSQNKAAAVKLLEYLVSAEAQALFAAENYEYPVRAGVKLSPTVAAWGSFVEDTQNLENLGIRSPAALKIADSAGWK